MLTNPLDLRLSVFVEAARPIAIVVMLPGSALHLTPAVRWITLGSMARNPDHEDDDMDDDEGEPVPEVVELEIGDELDLHLFRPDEVAELVPDYLAEAAARGFREVRIIHGKGRGTLRRIVHAALERSPLVESFGASERGSWGATLVKLKPAGS
jgi:hypothetical protein